MDQMQQEEYKKLKKQKEKQLKRQNEFNKNNYDRLGVVVEKGQKEIIINHLKQKGYKSFNAYITDLIYNDMHNIN